MLTFDSCRSEVCTTHVCPAVLGWGRGGGAVINRDARARTRKSERSRMERGKRRGEGDGGKDSQRDRGPARKRVKERNVY